MQRSRNRGYTLVEILIVLVIVGLLASIAVPAYVRVRANAQDRAVTNNLRQILSAAEQYFLDSGRTQVAITELLGTDKYIRNLEPVAGETYPAAVANGDMISAENVAGLRTITMR